MLTNSVISPSRVENDFPIRLFFGQKKGGLCIFSYDFEIKNVQNCTVLLYKRDVCKTEIFIRRLP